MKFILQLNLIFLALISIQANGQTSKVLERYPNNAVKQEMISAVDSSYSVLIDYYKNGKRQSVDTLVNDNLVGWSTEYNEDGTVYVSQLFNYNIPMVQRFFLYYKDGTLKTEWTSDTLRRGTDPVDIEPANGIWKEYYHNGKVKMVGRKNENRNNDGEWIYYDDSGKEAKRVFYINGKKVE
jgi:antitoxin component YwqK of YwqJK toxin-antitoxin module